MPSVQPQSLFVDTESAATTGYGQSSWILHLYLAVSALAPCLGERGATRCSNTAVPIAQGRTEPTLAALGCWAVPGVLLDQHDKFAVEAAEKCLAGLLRMFGVVLSKADSPLPSSHRLPAAPAAEQEAWQESVDALAALAYKYHACAAKLSAVSGGLGCWPAVISYVFCTRPSTCLSGGGGSLHGGVPA